MKNNKLPKHFFEENQLVEMSTAALTHFGMITQGVPELNEQIHENVSICPLTHMNKDVINKSQRHMPRW